MKIIIKRTLIAFSILCSFHLYSQKEDLAVISLDRIKIFYRGIENPITVAAQGIASDKIKVSISNGTITGSNGKYIVKVDSGKVSIVKVTADVIPGEVKIIGINTFMVKLFPNPIVCIGKYCTSNISTSKEELLKDTVISVSFNLPFDFKVAVTSFTFTYTKPNATDVDIIEQKVAGNKFTKEIINAISKMEKGTKIYIEDIKVLVQDGETRSLSPIRIILE